jgi:hypothetical protein
VFLSELNVIKPFGSIYILRLYSRVFVTGKHSCPSLIFSGVSWSIPTRRHTNAEAVRLRISLRKLACGKRSSLFLSVEYKKVLKPWFTGIQRFLFVHIFVERTFKINQRSLILDEISEKLGRFLKKPRSSLFW